MSNSNIRFIISERVNGLSRRLLLHFHFCFRWLILFINYGFIDKPFLSLFIEFQKTRRINKSC